MQAHLGTLATAFVAIVLFDRREWFGGDEWDFFAHYHLMQHPLEILRPHNEHLSVLPILVYKVLFHTVGLRSYLPYTIVLVACHIVTAHVIWRLTRRARADPWVSTAVVGVFLFLGAAWFNLVIAFQMSFVASTGFGLAILLVLSSPGGSPKRRTLAAWGIGICSLMCSGLGPIFILVAAMYAWIKDGFKTSLRVASVPGALYLIWFTAIGRHHVAALQQQSKLVYLQLPEFVWHGLSATLEGASRMKGAGGVLLLVLSIYVIWRRAWQVDEYLLVGALAIGRAVFFLAVGSGRLLFGPQYAEQSRYIYEGFALLIVPIAMGLSDLTRLGRVSRPILLIALVGITASGAYALRTEAAISADLTASERGRILAVAKLLGENSPVTARGSTIIQPESLDVDAVRRLVAEGALPISSSGSASDTQSLLAAQMQLQVALRPGQIHGIESAPRLLREVGVRGTGAADGCMTVESVANGSEMWFANDAGWQLQLTPLEGGLLHIRLESPDGLTSPSALGKYNLSREASVVLTVNAPNAATVLTLPAGVTLVCGADLSALQGSG